MWLALILLAQLLHREIPVPAGATSPGQNGPLAKSEWPLEECQDAEEEPAGCVCHQQYQVCQPTQLSAVVNGSVTLPCRFSYDSRWEPSAAAQVRWRLGGFHSTRYLFSCCLDQRHTDPEFQGRVSLDREEGQRHTASIRITALRESDSRLYFCRVSVKPQFGKEKEWQTITGTNLTVTAPPQPPEGRHHTTAFLAGVSTGAILLAAAIVLGLAMLLLAQRKDHCQKRTQTRRAASRGQGEKEPEYQELHCRGARAPPLEKPLPLPPPTGPRAQGEPPGPVYASLLLSDAPDKKRAALKREGGRAEEETTYAAVRQ
ncbi:PREDICTED: paired immunoglobulin-like type 2 receptor alpha [Gekko japonicus]|uniref:paired immunoglobulin-like type 2 receptor alpha n=1 Tax=Gekko japonicus TaxID=146911 RepID=UPI00074FE283|nr:PREDICTED: paired immunoglobulin-like type 2 receptor alpha [Gekko japonicus]